MTETELLVPSLAAIFLFLGLLCVLPVVLFGILSMGTPRGASRAASRDRRRQVVTTGAMVCFLLLAAVSYWVGNH